ncbi:IS630 family transposase [Bacteroidota bacterium]
MAQKNRKPIGLSNEDKTKLEMISTSRTESSSKVQRSKIILDFCSGETIAAMTRKYNTNRPLIERTIDKCIEYGPIQALTDLPRKGRPAEITDDAKSWVLSVACKKPTDFNLASETWTYSGLAKYIKNNCEKQGYSCLKNTGKSFLNNVLSKSNIKPHKVSYYLEKRDPEFDIKMASVLHVYKEVALINDDKLCAHKHTTVSYDEKPGIQAIKNIAPQLQPVPGKYSTISRDYEYKRLGTLSLLASIDLHTGEITPLVCERHRSKEFILFLKLMDKQYPKDWKIRVILDNHSSHISKETRAYLKTKPERFEFIFTPKHGSWLNMIEMFFSKIARGLLRQIRVESKEELKERIYKGISEINQEPVIFRWKYKMDEINLN